MHVHLVAYLRMERYIFKIKFNYALKKERSSLFNISLWEKDFKKKKGLEKKIRQMSPISHGITLT